MTTMKQNGLAKLVEETGELQQIVGKMIQYPELQNDPVTRHPSGYNLRDSLMDEAGDVLAAIDYVCEMLGLHRSEIESRRKEKLMRFRLWGNEGP